MHIRHAQLYMLLLGVTAVSLLTTPLVIRLSNALIRHTPADDGSGGGGNAGGLQKELQQQQQPAPLVVRREASDSQRSDSGGGGFGGQQAHSSPRLAAASGGSRGQLQQAGGGSGRGQALGRASSGGGGGGDLAEVVEVRGCRLLLSRGVLYYTLFQSLLPVVSPAALLVRLRLGECATGGGWRAGG